MERPILTPDPLRVNASIARRVARGIGVTLIWLGLIAAGVAAGYYGVQLRTWTWQQTPTIRFEGDVNNGYNQGRRVVDSAARLAAVEHRPANWHDFFNAYLNNYADVIAHSRSDDYGLDYAPGRLMVMSLWVKHLRETAPRIHHWTRAYETTAPLLNFNTVCEAISALMMIALVRHWRRATQTRDRVRASSMSWREWGIGWFAGWRRSTNESCETASGVSRRLTFRGKISTLIARLRGHHGAQANSPEEASQSLEVSPDSADATHEVAINSSRGLSLREKFASLRPLLPDWRHPWREIPPVLAGLAVWFNPALIWNAHAWPQWDSWVLPFYLLTILAASKNRWLLAGMIFTLGIAFKGQSLMVLPALLLWPLLMGRPLAVVRFFIGGTMSAALVVLPWMANTPSSQFWLIGVLVAVTATSLLLGVRRKFDLFGILAAALAGLIVLACLLNHASTLCWQIACPLAVLTAVLPRWLPRGWRLPFAAFVMATAVFLAGFAFNGQFAWFEIGYVYPQHHYNTMVMSGGNLPRILAWGPYNWGLTDTVSLPGLPDMPMRSFLITLYTTTLILCGIAAAMQAWRRSPRLLIALAAPWVLMFTLMPQMHERYPMWGAVLMCAGFGLTLGDALLAMLVTFLAWANMAEAMLGRDRELMPWASDFFRGMNLGSSWAMVLLAGVCLYAAFVRGGGRFAEEPNERQDAKSAKGRNAKKEFDFVDSGIVIGGSV